MKFSKYYQPRKKRKPRRKNDIYLPCLACSDVFGTREWFVNQKYHAEKERTANRTETKPET